MTQTINSSSLILIKAVCHYEYSISPKSNYFFIKGILEYLWIGYDIFGFSIHKIYLISMTLKYHWLRLNTNMTLYKIPF